MKISYYCVKYALYADLQTAAATAVETERSTVSDVFLSSGIDCIQRLIDRSLCPVLNELTGSTLGKGGTEEVVMETTFSYIVVCYASGQAWQ